MRRLKWLAGLFWRFVHRMRFRYDIFISYARSDGQPYARQLRDQLRQLDFTCFLDDDEIQAGDQLRGALKRSLHASAALVVVGTRAAALRPFVKLEVEEFAATGRRILPININDSLAATAWSTARGDEVVWIAETSFDTPSPAVAETIEKNYQFRKRKRLLFGARPSFFAPS